MTWHIYSHACLVKLLQASLYFGQAFILLTHWLPNSDQFDRKYHIFLIWNQKKNSVEYVSFTLVDWKCQISQGQDKMFQLLTTSWIQKLCVIYKYVDITSWFCKAINTMWCFNCWNSFLYIWDWSTLALTWHTHYPPPLGLFSPVRSNHFLSIPQTSIDLFCC